MKENSICEHCKKPFVKHTKEELLSCKLEIIKKTEDDTTDKEIIEDFNEIKSSEFYRMSKN